MDTHKTLTVRKILAEKLANLVAETVIHSPDIFDREVEDVVAHPSSGFRGDGFVVQLKNGMGFVVQVQTYNDSRERADVMCYNNQHQMAPWKPIRSASIHFVTSCINCNKVAMTHADGSVGGPAVLERCYVDPMIVEERKEEV